MPSPLLTMLPDAPETIAFRAVVTILQTDPYLNRAGISWQVWDNSPTDTPIPTLSQLPYVQLTPAPELTSWAEESQHRSNFRILVGMAVQGTHSDDLMNLWGAIRLALFPQDVTRRNHVRAKLGPLMVNGGMSAQPFEVQAVADSAKMLVATGALSLKLFVNT